MTEQEKLRLACFAAGIEIMVFTAARNWQRTVKIDKELRDLIAKACRSYIAKES